MATGEKAPLRMTAAYVDQVSLRLKWHALRARSHIDVALELYLSEREYCATDPIMYPLCKEISVAA